MGKDRRRQREVKKRPSSTLDRGRAQVVEVECNNY